MEHFTGIQRIIILGRYVQKGYFQIVQEMKIRTADISWPKEVYEHNLQPSFAQIKIFVIQTMHLIVGNLTYFQSFY